MFYFPGSIPLQIGSDKPNLLRHDGRLWLMAVNWRGPCIIGKGEQVRFLAPWRRFSPVQGNAGPAVSQRTTGQVSSDVQRGRDQVSSRRWKPGLSGQLQPHFWPGRSICGSWSLCIYKGGTTFATCLAGMLSVLRGEEPWLSPRCSV